MSSTKKVSIKLTIAQLEQLLACVDCSVGIDQETRDYLTTQWELAFETKDLLPNNKCRYVARYSEVLMGWYVFDCVAQMYKGANNIKWDATLSFESGPNARFAAGIWNWNKE